MERSEEEQWPKKDVVIFRKILNLLHLEGVLRVTSAERAEKVLRLAKWC